MEILKNSFNPLSTKINVNKTKAIGNNEIDKTFSEVLIKGDKIYIPYYAHIQTLL